MPNPDRPRGFTPMHMLSGAPWAGNVRSVGVEAGTDIFLGDLLVLNAGGATPGATTATNFVRLVLVNETKPVVNLQVLITRMT